MAFVLLRELLTARRSMIETKISESLEPPDKLNEATGSLNRAMPMIGMACGFDSLAMFWGALRRDSIFNPEISEKDIRYYPYEDMGMEMN